MKQAENRFALPSNRADHIFSREITELPLGQKNGGQGSRRTVKKNNPVKKRLTKNIIRSHSNSFSDTIPLRLNF